MDSVVHFEMPYEDPERIAKFYQSAFGWETKNLGESMGGYVLATTTETDPATGPTKPGAINGGFFPKQADRSAQGPSIVVAVDNIVEAIDRVARAGGKVLGEPMEIPGVGQYVAFKDPEGNQVSMLEPTPANKQKRSAEPENARTAEHGSHVAPVGSSEQQQQQWSPKQPGNGHSHGSGG